MKPQPGFRPDTTSTVTPASVTAVGLPGVAVVHPHVADGWCDRFGLAQQCGECGPILQVGRGEDGGDQDTSSIDQRMPFDAVDLGRRGAVVAATAEGTEVARISEAPKALAAGLKRQRRLSKSLSRKQKGSHHRTDAAARLGRHHHRVANVRRNFLHQVSGELVKTHDRLAVENLNVAGMLANHRLARAISDAGWSEFARLLAYKQAWRGGQLIEADRGTFQCVCACTVFLSTRLLRWPIVCSPVVAGIAQTETPTPR